MHEDKLIKTVRTAENESKLRVWNVINPPSETNYYAVDSPEEAAEVILDLINEQLEDDGVWANAFGLEEYEIIDNNWYEWEDTFGDFGANNIDDLVDDLMDKREQEAQEEHDSLKGE